MLRSIFVLVVACIASTHAACGRISPSGNVNVLIGEPLNLTCTLTPCPQKNTSDFKNSSYIAWFRQNERIDNKFVRIVNENSSELYIPNAQLDLANYICKLIPRSNDIQGIEMKQVSIGYRHGNVSNFVCRSPEWANFTCKFHGFNNTIMTSYQLKFTIDGKMTFDCALEQKYDHLYVGTITTNSIGGIFRPTYRNYTFTVHSNNTFGEYDEQFEVDLFKSIIPGPPINLSVQNVKPNSVTLTWNAPLELRKFEEPLVHSISYLSQYDNGVWRHLQPLIVRGPRNHRKLSYDLSDLPFAFMEYNVRVRVRVADADDTFEMWSKNASIIFESGKRIPQQPPTTDVGGFYVDDNDNVYVYWRELPKYHENGPNFHYVVSSNSSGQTAHPTTISNFMAKFDNVRHNRDKDLHFQISSRNSVGESSSRSSLFVPRRSHRCPSPVEIRNVLHHTNHSDPHYEFSWRAPFNYSDITGQPLDPIISYTVFWCKTRTQSPNHCDGEFNFTRVPASENSFRYHSNDTLNFAVSANTARSSSGMSWARCTAIANRETNLNKVSDVRWTALGSVNASIEWNTECIDESVSTGYIIKFCLVIGVNGNCLEEPRNVSVDGAAQHNRTITGLSPYSTYKVNVAAKSTKNIGPYSDRFLFTTREASPTQPRNLMVKERNDTSVTLEWEAPERLNGVLSRYEVLFNQHKTSVQKTGSMNNVTYVRNDLTPNTEYVIAVSACTRATWCSNYSEPITTVTDVGRPSVVRLVEEQANTIMWTPPEHPGGGLDYYELEVKMDSSRTERVLLNGTRCTVMLACEVGARYVLRVRAVNLVRLPHGLSNVTNKSHEGGLSSMRICEEQDNKIWDRVTVGDKFAGVLTGNWTQAKDLVCPSGNGAMILLLVAIMLTVMFTGYLSGTVVYRKLHRMKDIFVEMPEGLVQAVAMAKASSQQCTGRKGGPGGSAGSTRNGVAGIATSVVSAIGAANGAGGGGPVLGTSVVNGVSQLFSPKSGAEQEERLLSRTSENSISQSSAIIMDDCHSSGGSSHAYDDSDGVYSGSRSNGSGADNSSGRTLLMGAGSDQSIGFSCTSPMTSKLNGPPFRTANMPIAMPAMPLAVPMAPMSTFGYVPHEALLVQQPVQQPASDNGYTSWNAVAMAAAAMNSSQRAPLSPASDPYMPRELCPVTTPAIAEGVKDKDPDNESPAIAGDAAESMADKTATSISGYVTHKQLSDFGQLVQ